MALPSFHALILAAPLFGSAVPDTGAVIIGRDALAWLDQQAMAYAYTSRRSDLVKAAAWHRLVVDSRRADDPKRFHCLRTHAELLNAIGDLDGAQRRLEEAARLAEGRSEVYDAAMAYIDAALLAVEADDARGARRLAWRARVLSGSPRLTEVQQRAVLLRLDPVPPRASTLVIGGESPGVEP